MRDAKGRFTSNKQKKIAKLEFLIRDRQGLHIITKSEFVSKLNEVIDVVNKQDAYTKGLTEEENPIKQELLIKAEELIKKANELKKQAE